MVYESVQLMNRMQELAKNSAASPDHHLAIAAHLCLMRLSDERWQDVAVLQVE